MNGSNNAVYSQTIFLIMFAHVARRLAGFLITQEAETNCKSVECIEQCCKINTRRETCLRRTVSQYSVLNNVKLYSSSWQSYDAKRAHVMYTWAQIEVLQQV